MASNFANHQVKYLWLLNISRFSITEIFSSDKSGCGRVCQLAERFGRHQFQPQSPTPIRYESRCGPRARSASATKAISASGSGPMYVTTTLVSRQRPIYRLKRGRYQSANCYRYPLAASGRRSRDHLDGTDVLKDAHLVMPCWRRGWTDDVAERLASASAAMASIGRRIRQRLG